MPAWWEIPVQTRFAVRDGRVWGLELLNLDGRPCWERPFRRERRELTLPEGFALERFDHYVAVFRTPRGRVVLANVPKEDSLFGREQIIAVEDPPPGWEPEAEWAGEPYRRVMELASPEDLGVWSFDGKRIHFRHYATASALGEVVAAIRNSLGDKRSRTLLEPWTSGGYSRRRRGGSASRRTSGLSPGGRSSPPPP